MSEQKKEKTVAARYFEGFLTGVLEAGARAAAKAVESLAGDAKKALQNEAAKAEFVEQGAKFWRASKLGDPIDTKGESR